MKHLKRNLKSLLAIALLFLTTSTAWSQDCWLWVSEEGWQGDYIDFVAKTGDVKKYIAWNTHDDGSPNTGCTITAVEGSPENWVDGQGYVHWGKPGWWEVYFSCQTGCENTIGIEVYLNEVAYPVTGGGAICTGNTTTVNLSNSQSSLVYYLYKDGTQVPNAQQAGTDGVALHWTVAAPGVYTVKTFNTTMSGSPQVTVNPIPSPAFTQSPGASALTNTNVTYSTAAGQSNYVWNIPGTLNTDYSITSGSTGTGSNTVTLKWLTLGSKTVTVGYTSNGCASATPASVTTTVTISAPSAPSALTVSPASATQINLNWVDNSNNETGFQIERSTTSGSGFALIATTAANTTSYNNTGLPDGTTYLYRLRAINTVGNSSYTSEGTATTPIIPPSMLIATLNPSTQINLTWTDNSASETGFQIERSIAGGNFVVIGTTSPNVTTYTDANVQEELHYYYRICAVKPGGNSVYTPVAEVNTPSTPPIAPSSLVATPTSSTQINLTWTDNSNNETGFQVEQSSTPGGAFTVIATTAANVTSYSIQGLLVNTPYYYRIRAINTAYTSAYTTEAPATTLTEIQSVLSNLAYQYEYDARQRMTHKKIPGADWVYMVYDLRDRLVMSQDGEQRKLNQWTFTRYDAFNRPVMTGIYTHTAAVDQAGMSGLISTTNFFETYTGDAANHGYSNTVFSSTSFPGSFEALTVTYYDNYNFRSLWTGTYGYTSDGLSATVTNGATYTQPTTADPSVVGRVTGAKVKVLDGGSTWLKSISYYDDRYRTIQIISDNIKGGTDRISNLYDFVGKVLKTKTTHGIAGGASQNIVRSMEYDHGGRPQKIYHSINGATPVLLTANEYNELGQLVDKKLHSTDNGSTFKQSVDYRYNIRSWLTSINNASLTNDDTGDLFSMNLNYNTPTANGGAAQYNGNISEILWRGPDAKTNSYGYSYDPMNRLTEAKYYNAADATKNGRFNEKIWDQINNQSGYDLNGNIKFLTRAGNTGVDAIGKTTYGQMDNLAYAYQGNQLLRVTDASTKTTGFIDGVNLDDDYGYDDNGNMTHDLNKGIGSTLADNTNKIFYNHLNLPTRVQKSANSYIQYIYDATGRKLQQVAIDNGGPVKTTDYAGEFIYENNVLQFINHEEGRITMTGSQPEYQYHLKDHLGNIRVTFTTKQETESPKATLETSNQANDIANFVRYDKARKIKSNLFDYTNGLADGYAQRLNGTENEKFGIARSLSVMPGDKITAEVYGKYIDTNPSHVESWLTTLMTQIAMGTAAAGTVADGGDYANSTSSFPYSGLITRSNDTGTGPKAYLNWLVFDRDHNQIPAKCGYYRIGTTSDPRETGQNVAHERLFSPEITIDQAGFVYIYLSNEESTPVEVFFDDLKVTQVKSPVIASNDYYPFGLTFNEYNRENGLKQDYLYNGKELQDELNLGWLDYGARMYDPTIARWMAVDPLADLSRKWSPYTYGNDNPIRFIDPTGMYSTEEWKRDNGVTDKDVTNIYTAGDGGMALFISYPDANPDIPSNQGLAKWGEKTFGDGDGKVNAGHAGVVLINDKGKTTYFDFGRYSRPDIKDRKRVTDEGAVRSNRNYGTKLSVPDWNFDKTDNDNINAILTKLHSSPLLSDYGRIVGALAKNLNYSLMLTYARNAENEGYLQFGGYTNGYDYCNNATYCAKFARGVGAAGGFDWDWDTFTGLGNVEDVNALNEAESADKCRFEGR